MTDDYDQVMALYHWPLDSITTDAFKRLYQRFMAAAFDLIDEINEMALKTPQVIPLHEGRS
ncbi:MAG: hypothetical protein M5U34_04780 [Chloroflexi bacterium]|nr:hypothetical protein [Chloroflexota bacterium]